MRKSILAVCVLCLGVAVVGYAREQVWRITVLPESEGDDDNDLSATVRDLKTRVAALEVANGTLKRHLYDERAKNIRVVDGQPWSYEQTLDEIGRLPRRVRDLERKGE